MNLQSRHSWQLAHNHLGYYHAPANYYEVSRNMGDDHNSAFIAHNTYYSEDEYSWAATNNVNGYYYGENIDGVFVTDAAALFPTNMQSSQARNHRQAPSNHYRNSRNSAGNHLGPHNNFDFPNTGHTYSYLRDPYYYQPTLTDQFIDEAYVTTDDVNQLIETMQNLDPNFGSHLSGQPIDYSALLDLGDDDMGVGDHEEDIIIVLKTRPLCAKVEVDSEICAICM
ncbi:hypothetical protein RND71_035565 [Anisodus tanguticus]|uniref:Uncharacterized protein n=1 Tax=Anisodus tanguticus TaxID=243964 RepID=A0AAE1R4H5_9SOLA|nr:hypothetical protein RND71_035565 [Anisodus tanguticus]